MQPNAALSRAGLGPTQIGALEQAFQPGGGSANPTDTAPTPDITGFDANLMGLALSTLASFPGSPFGFANTAVKAGRALGAMPDANLSYQGVPVSYEGPHSLMGLLSSLFGFGRPASFTAVGPTGELSNVAIDRSGETGAMGLGAQAAYDAVAAGRSPYDAVPAPPPSFQGRTGIGVDDDGAAAAAAAAAAAQAEADAASESVGGGGGSGSAPGSGSSGGGPSGATGDGPY
jgi:hypothetical protein